MIVKSTRAKPYLGTIYGHKTDLALKASIDLSFLSYIEIFKRYNILSETTVEFLF